MDNEVRTIVTLIAAFATALLVVGGLTIVSDYMSDRCRPITPTYHATADEPLFREVWRP